MAQLRVQTRRSALRGKAGTILLLSALVACEPPPDTTRLNEPLPEDVDISERKSGRYGDVFVESNAQEPKTFNPLVSE